MNDNKPKLIEACLECGGTGVIKGIAADGSEDKKCHCLKTFYFDNLKVMPPPDGKEAIFFFNNEGAVTEFFPVMDQPGEKEVIWSGPAR